MKFTRSVLAASIIAVVSLAGCGSDSKTEVPEVVVGQGQFIDAAVEGIYYHSQPSGKFGFTDAEGVYNYDAGDTITFFLGGSNGLRIGSTSARDVVSPFEATGNYQKAVNLARILQSMDDPSNGSITLPDSVTSPGPGMIAALNNLLLHDLESANDLQDELGLTEWVSEEDALEHLNDSLEGLERGSNEVLTEWQRGSGNIVRTIYSTLSAQNPYDVKERLYVTADKLLDEELFEATRGLINENMRLDTNNAVRLVGSNDQAVTEVFAQLYLTCIDEFGLDAEYVNPEDSGNGLAQCNGEDIRDINPKFDLGSTFDYSLLSPESESDADEEIPWEYMRQFGTLYQCMDDQNCSEANLTGFSITTFDDSDDQDGSKMKREVLSTSYDSVSGVYTEIKKSFIESGIHDGRVSESLSFSYIVDSSESERYVDFIGTWNAVETKAGCDVVATSTYVFDANGVTVNGEEFNSGCQLEEIEATATYEELSDMDFWWFTTNGLNNDSKATLTQLNSTIRWCDADDMESAYTECHDSDIKFNRWEYAPAGQKWDQGVLNRRTLSTGGQTVSTISMYKL